MEHLADLRSSNVPPGSGQTSQYKRYGLSNALQSTASNFAPWRKRTSDKALAFVATNPTDD